MKLYHYAFTKKVLEEGLEPFIKHEDTKIINSLIWDKFETYFDRNYCVFFNQDYRDLGEIIVSVDVSNLDDSFLFVADQDLANDIYNNWYKGEDCSEIVDRYVKSIKKFSDYKNEYENSEVFYTEYIEPELLTVEYINKDFFKEEF